uniref:Cathepsin L.1 n=1 Tax=Callorhinchus milii TaxID=7868 RepID=A0A4W3K499_CALMI|eukprot:gi/632954425/ref/XP_007892957.1/ PREDICTED: cathepsin L1-like isoform X1 [Callorhinchus milii]
MKILILAAIASLTEGIPGYIWDTNWQEWKAKFGKSYSPSEEVQRVEIWLTNLKKVLEHNMLADRGLTTYRLEMNAFADLENEEYRRLVLGKCLRRSNVTKTAAATAPNLQSPSLPSQVDWRDEGYVTPIKDQSSCGSCWAFSATGAMEGQHCRNTGVLVSLSEQQLVDCSGSYGNEGCNGGLMDYAFQYVIDNGGIDTEASYPYEAQDEQCRSWGGRVGATFSQFINLPAGSEADLQSAAASVGPISIAIDASHRSFQFYSSGIYNEPDCSSTELDHGVLVVGYGSLYGEDYWLVKNSWGIEWGDDGYIYMSRNRGNQCGVATAASYPLV